MDTKEVQEHLRAIGWPITVDGIAGPMTTNAVADFQRGYAFTILAVDGNPGPATQAALSQCRRDGGTCGTYFTFREFASKGNGWIKVHRTLVYALDRYRELVGAPVGIESGYRDPKHNAAVGGAKNSIHLYGGAADLRPVLSVTKVKSLGLFSGIGRVGSTGLVRHVDIRGQGGVPATTPGTPSAPTQWVYA